MPCELLRQENAVTGDRFPRDVPGRIAWVILAQPCEVLAPAVTPPSLPRAARERWQGQPRWRRAWIHDAMLVELDICPGVVKANRKACEQREPTSPQQATASRWHLRSGYHGSFSRNIEYVRFAACARQCQAEAWAGGWIL